MFKQMLVEIVFILWHFMPTRVKLWGTMNDGVHFDVRLDSKKYSLMYRVFPGLFKVLMIASVIVALLLVLGGCSVAPTFGPSVIETTDGRILTCEVGVNIPSPTWVVCRKLAAGDDVTLYPNAVRVLRVL